MPSCLSSNLLSLSEPQTSIASEGIILSNTASRRLAQTRSRLKLNGGAK